MKTDLERLRRTFADPALAWILERLRRRLESGRLLTGTITLRRPSRQEREALDRLLGRRPTRGATLTLRLEELELILRHAELCDGLADAVRALVGPVTDRRGRKARLDAEWAGVFAAVTDPDERPQVLAWLDERRTRLLARRYAGQDPGRGRALLEQAMGVIRHLPVRGRPLAELAAALTGDSHALDDGRPLGTLVISAAAKLGRVDDWHGAEARRDVWASVGVLVDELSAPVLTLNLRGDAESLTGRTLRLHAASGEPCRLSTRQLVRHPATFGPMATVYVCENPTVVAAAANRLRAKSAPLISTEGQPKTACRILLNQIAELGIRIAYHGDFDWAGIRIANLVMERHGAVPWRFTAVDYCKAAAAGKELAGQPVPATWDEGLAPAMSEVRRAVHEEQVLDELLADLAS